MSRRKLIRARKSRYLERSRTMFRKISDMPNYELRNRIGTGEIGRIERFRIIVSPDLK